MNGHPYRPRALETVEEKIIRDQQFQIESLRGQLRYTEAVASFLEGRLGRAVRTLRIVAIVAAAAIVALAVEAMFVLMLSRSL